ncbi:protein kinase [Naegleria gruberi]|uniref:Protein kinase n=1 Tax=Naegleria gruberi TaxID=5762 RepID=D2VP18_NAEGR|nr:protein kinase [Naegleria gruberi]EFC41583.1 protein kinase [Naegleria gruberi]|eukprot:XP_002674327.1 protein kinase [Naegleria gruberi]
MVKGSSRFELQEEDTLPEKERIIQNELSPGEYSIIIESAGNSKFQFIFKVTSSQGQEIFLADGILYGRGQKGEFNNTFSISEENGNSNVELRLINRARFWQKPAYKFQLVKCGDDQIHSAQENLVRSFDTSISTMKRTSSSGSSKKSNTSSITKSNSSNSLSGKRIKVKLSYKEETTIVSVFLGMSMDGLFEIISSHYNNFLACDNLHDKINIKYADDEDKNELISIRTQTDLDHFVESSVEKFLNFQNSVSANVYKKPKLIIEDSANKLRNDGLPSSPLTTTKKFPSRRVSKIKTWIKGNMIGAGANGKVYLGINSETGQMMAIKEIEIKGKTNREEVKKIMEEVELMSQFDHPHIVRYLGSFVANNHLNIFLDYIPGGSMETLLLEFSLPENLIRKYSKQILEGLSYLHENGIVHCDIKSGNILVDERSNVYLTDFGCSKKLSSLALGDETTQTINSNIIRGTPNYIAPEVIRDRSYTQAADIWSFGCTICEMFSQNPPWSHVLSKFEQPVHPIQLMHYIMTTEDDSVEIPSNSSQVAKDFIRSCLQRDPSKRPTAKQLLQHPFITIDLVEALSTFSQVSVNITPRTPHEYTTRSKKGDDEEEEYFEDDGFTFDDYPNKYFSDDSDDEDLYSNNPIYRTLSTKRSLRQLSSRPTSSHTNYSTRSTKDGSIYGKFRDDRLAPPKISGAPIDISISPPNESVLSEATESIEVWKQDDEPESAQTEVRKTRTHSADLRKHTSAHGFVGLKNDNVSSRFSTMSVRANENDIKNFLRNTAHNQQSSLSSARKVEAQSTDQPETTITITRSQASNQ